MRDDLTTRVPVTVRWAKVVVATEARYVRGTDGVVRTPVGVNDYGFWSRYLEVFDEVVVLARVKDASGTEGQPVGGPSVRVVPVADFVGGGLAAAIWQVRRDVHAACSGEAAFIARLPGIIGGVMVAHLRARGRPYAIEVVGDPYDVLHTASAPSTAARLMRRFSRWQLRRQCTGAAAVAYVTRDALQRRYPASGNASVTFYSSITLTDEAYVPAPPRVRDGQAVLLAVGTHSQLYKGHDVLIDATALLQERGVDVRLRLVGAGRYHQDLRTRAVIRGVAGVVTFVGQVAPAQIVRELDGADLFVHPARTEGLPRALIEAMARGLPCVASRVGGIPELLSDEDLVPPGSPDALADLLETTLADPGRRAAMAQRNLATASAYHSDALARRRSWFYRAVAGASHVGRDAARR